MSSAALQWVAFRVQAQTELKVQNKLTQREHPALVPVEWKWRRRNTQSRLRVKRAYPLFVSYVFAGIHGWGDFRDIRDNIDDVMGVVAFNGKPSILSANDVRFIASLSGREATMVDINPHKALVPGGAAQIIAGPFAGQSVKIDSVSAKRAKVLMNMLNSMQIVEISVAALEAA